MGDHQKESADAGSAMREHCRRIRGRIGSFVPVPSGCCGLDSARTKSILDLFRAIARFAGRYAGFKTDRWRDALNSRARNIATRLRGSREAPRGACPASNASCQRGGQRHQRSPALSPGKPNSGIGVERSLPRDFETLRNPSVMTTQTVWLWPMRRTRPTSLCFSITTRETRPLGTGSRPTRLSHSGNLATHRVAGPPCLVQPTPSPGSRSNAIRSQTRDNRSSLANANFQAAPVCANGRSPSRSSIPMTCRPLLSITVRSVFSLNQAEACF
jgi:hypothetical protein